MATFLEEYTHYAAKGNEVPEIYHTWSGIAALSMCAGKRFWLRASDDYIIHPNLYILLVGSPGGRKSSAMGVAKNLIRDIGGIPLCANQITKEAMAKEMTQEDFDGRKSFIDPVTKRMTEFTEYAIFANEWVHFIAVNPTGMIDFFTEVWDQHIYDAKTKNMGNDLIIGPCIPLLGCMTPATSTAQMKADIINGGFARRCIFVYATQTSKPVPFPTKTDGQLDARKRCIEMGKKISASTKFCGEFDWAPGAMEWYTDWYGKHYHKIKELTNPWTEGYYRSRHDLLLKVGLLMEVGKCNDRNLTIESLVQADAFLTATEVHLPKIFEDAGRNEQSVIANIIMEKLRNHGKLNRKRLQKEMFGHATTQEFGTIIEHLKQTDQIVEVVPEKGGQSGFMTKEDYDNQS